MHIEGDACQLGQKHWVFHKSQGIMTGFTNASMRYNPIRCLALEPASHCGDLSFSVRF
jgi:hypothetical protein